MTNATTEAAQTRAARLAGALYLITMATGVFGEIFVRGSLIVSDVTQTAQNIIASERLFRIGIVSDLATFTGVLVLTWALYVLLRPVDRDLALLAAFFRVVEVAVSTAATVNSLVALRLLSSAEYLEAFEVSQLHTLSRLARNAFGFGFDIGFVLTGLGSAVFAYLLLKSRYVPQVLAGWGVFASLLFATHAVLIIVFPSAAEILRLVSYIPMGIYEVTLGFWLLLKGARLQASSSTLA
jgi:hypothetical protein